MLTRYAKASSSWHSNCTALFQKVWLLMFCDFQTYSIGHIYHAFNCLQLPISTSTKIHYVFHAYLLEPFFVSLLIGMGTCAPSKDNHVSQYYQMPFFWSTRNFSPITKKYNTELFVAFLNPNVGNITINCWPHWDYTDAPKHLSKIIEILIIWKLLKLGSIYVCYSQHNIHIIISIFSFVAQLWQITSYSVLQSTKYIRNLIMAYLFGALQDDDWMDTYTTPIRMKHLCSNSLYKSKMNSSIL